MWTEIWRAGFDETNGRDNALDLDLDIAPPETITQDLT